MLEIRGSAGVYWNDLEKEGHVDKILYIDEHIPLMNVDSGCNEFPLNPGRHTFNFEFTIPQGCPSSYESKQGRVRYIVKLVYINNLLISEKCVGFTVIKPLNLNNHGANLAVSFLNSSTSNFFKNFKF